VSLVREPNAPDASRPSEPKYFISIIEDISERSTAEQALQRFRRLVESIFGAPLANANHANDLFPGNGGDMSGGSAYGQDADQMTPPEFTFACRQKN